MGSKRQQQQQNSKKKKKNKQRSEKRRRLRQSSGHKNREHKFRTQERRVKEDEQKHYVFVSNLSKRVKKENLEKLFGVYGTVIDVVIVDRRESSMKYAFVYFEEKEAAEQALKMDGEPVKCEIIKVEAGARIIPKLDARKGSGGQLRRERGRHGRRDHPY